MKQVFNIAILHAEDKDIQLTLEQYGDRGQQIRLGGVPYSLLFTGDDLAREKIIAKLEETFPDADNPVTKGTLQHGLEPFGIVAVTTRSEKLKRGLKRAAVMGRGLDAMSQRDAQDEARGRSIVESPYINLYMEVSLEGEGEGEVFAKQKDGVFRCWQADEKTNLSLPEWEAHRIKQWEAASTESNFLPWLYRQTWAQSGTKEDMLSWFLRQDHERFNVSEPFDTWKQTVISDITKHYGQYLDKTATQAQILTSWLEKATSGLNLSDSDYVAFSQWRKTNAPGSFEDAIIRMQWEKTDKSQSLDDYTASKAQTLEERWEKCGLKQAGVDFTAWRKMQDPSLVTDTGLRPFVLCDTDTRKLFRLSSTSSGKLLRNDQPYSTEYESTLHSGKGYAIFVVGPDETIYAGTHIQQVFHHSSFLANEATLASGELRMGLDCFIQHAKDKDGAEVIQKKFITNNKDPYKKQFVKNEKDNTWAITGENAEGSMETIPVPSDSALEQVLQDPAIKDLPFSKRTAILNEAAALLGRTNPTDQVTLISSKSGHYQPRDEDNYYMLKLWERHGVDLTKTPFISLSTNRLFRSAREYLDEIEPRMKERQKTRLFVEAGSMQNHLHEPLSSVEKTIVINDRGECYEWGLSHPGFTHPEVLDASSEYGRQTIRGGGVMTLNTAGEVIKIDAKLGKYELSAKEIEQTLLTFKRRGVQLENVSLIAYDETGRSASPQNANQYLKALAQAPKLQKIAESGHVPAVSYSYVEPQKDADEFSSTSMAVGKKNAQTTTDAKMNTVDGNTQFPASSVSKVVFTYLVLQLVKDEQIDLDEPLHDILPYERFMKDGAYPQKAMELTARHVLSHTTGLPNLGPDQTSPLTFSSKSKLGEGYSYSGEAILYLQKVIETKMGKDLETLSREYVFDPLGMDRSTFIPPSEADTNVVAVHTELGKPTLVYVGDPPQNAAGSLLTTGEDFSKFISAWLENMDDPIIKQAFEPTNADDFMTCGLGWHIYRNEDEVIAYQFGENPNTRAFVAINLTEKKGAAFFTNSENGMSIANQVFNSPDLAPIGDMQAIYKHLHYTQSDEPGWQETISGKVAEAEGKFEEARSHFERALELSPEDESKQRRLEWFNTVHQPSTKKEFTSSLKAVVGNYKNPYNDEVEVTARDGGLVFKQFDQEIKLVRISGTEFLPVKDQSFKIRFDGDRMSISFVHGGPDKSLTKQPSPKSQSHYKDALRQLREESQPGYMRSTESSRAKEREKYEDTTPKITWKP